MAEQIHIGIGRPDKKSPFKGFMTRIAATGIVAGGMLTGCNGNEGVHPSQIPTFEETPGITEPYISPATATPEILPTVIVESGPESTPEASVSYPQSLSVEQVKSLLEQKPTPMPGELLNDVRVKEIVARHTEWVRSAGLNFIVVPVTTIDGHWFIELQNKDGSVAGWLKIEDTSSQSGWRYGEQPTYDSQFIPGKDKFTFGLPALHNSDNHFEILYQGFPLLVEMNANGEPQYWNNIVAKEMQEVQGAKIVAPEFTAGNVHEGMELSEYNQLSFDKLDKQMPILIATIRADLEAKGIPFDQIPAVTISSPNYREYYPYESLHIVIHDGVLDGVRAFSVLTMPNGETVRVAHVAVKVNKPRYTSQTAILSFAYMYEDYRNSKLAKPNPEEIAPGKAPENIFNIDLFTKNSELSFIPWLYTDGANPSLVGQYENSTLILEKYHTDKNAYQSSKKLELKDIGNWATATIKLYIASGPEVTPETEAALIKQLETTIFPCFAVFAN